MFNLTYVPSCTVVCGNPGVALGVSGWQGMPRTVGFLVLFLVLWAIIMARHVVCFEPAITNKLVVGEDAGCAERIEKPAVRIHVTRPSWVGVPRERLHLRGKQT